MCLVCMKVTRIVANWSYRKGSGDRAFPPVLSVLESLADIIIFYEHGDTFISNALELKQDFSSSL